MIVFSGEMRFTLSILGNRIQLTLFVASSLLFYILSRRRVLPSKINCLIFLLLFVWVILSSFFFNIYANDFTWVRFVLLPLGTCYIIGGSNFYVFRDALLRVLTILSLISIFIQLGHDYYALFPTELYSVEQSNFALSLGFFNTEWGEKRLASIYWEPGQYQIVLVYVLCLFYDEWSDLSLWKKSLKKFGGLLIALLLTVSTTGYISLAIMIFAIFTRVSVRRTHFFSYLAIFVVSLISIKSLYESRAIQEKVEQQQVDDEHTSYAVRVADNIALFQCAKERPLTGYGPGSPELNKKLISYGSQTSSNGWLKGAAQLGIPYIVFLLFLMYYGLYKMHQEKFRIIPIFIALIVSQANESSLYFPYLYMYVFRFLR